MDCDAAQELIPIQLASAPERTSSAAIVGGQVTRYRARMRRGASDSGWDGFPRHAGDVLTLFRIGLTPVFVALVMWSGPRGAAGGWTAVGVFASVAASDFFDGRLARRAGNPGLGGRVLDHGADILFILSALLSYVALGLAPWWVPASVAVAFATYALGAWNDGERPLRPSRIGHTGGVLNYVLIGVLVCNDTAGLWLLPNELLTGLFLLVPLYSSAAIVERLRPRVLVVRPPVVGDRRD